MRITAKIHEVFNNEKSNVKATASAAFGGQFAVHGFTVMNGKNGLFLNMPSKMNDEGEYVSTFHPITKDARTQLNNTILEAYEQALTESQAQSDEPSEDEGESEDEDFEEITDDQEMGM